MQVLLSYGPSPEAAVQDDKENTKPVKVNSVISIVCRKFHVVVLLYKQLPDYLPEHDPHTAVDSDTVS